MDMPTTPLKDLLECLRVWTLVTTRDTKQPNMKNPQLVKCVCLDAEIFKKEFWEAYRWDLRETMYRCRGSKWVCEPATNILSRLTVTSRAMEARQCEAYMAVVLNCAVNIA